MPHLASIPALNAILNGTCTLFLLLGLTMVIRGKILPHKICMVTAFLCSAAFLVLYVYFHLNAGLIRFGGLGWIRPVYFTILISHTILAVLSLPLIIITLGYALSSRFRQHRRIALWTFPIWLYVSITGVVVYWLLYVAYTPVWSPSTLAALAKR
ncbi:MAG TPA: DUF420 domain-containing protein [Candidatus Cybelea sp.]|nr:DUF420 domain-containing protein [Candidatus Cybelea sp.]